MHTLDISCCFTTVLLPKPKWLDHVDLLRDANNLIGKMKTMYERYNKPRRERSPFYRKLTRAQHRYWLTDNQALENIAHGLKMRLASIQYEQSERDNLSYRERKALTDLMSRTDIVINKADKGSTTVVIDRGDYIRDAGLTTWQTNRFTSNWPQMQHLLEEQENPIAGPSAVSSQPNLGRIIVPHQPDPNPRIKRISIPRINISGLPEETAIKPMSQQRDEGAQHHSSSISVLQAKILGPSGPH